MGLEWGEKRRDRYLSHTLALRAWSCCSFGGMGTSNRLWTFVVSDKCVQKQFDKRLGEDFERGEGKHKPANFTNLTTGVGEKKEKHANLAAGSSAQSTFHIQNLPAYKGHMESCPLMVPSDWQHFSNSLRPKPFTVPSPLPKNL